jgi:hypothetical protein
MGTIADLPTIQPQNNPQEVCNQMILTWIGDDEVMWSTTL